MKRLCLALLLLSSHAATAAPEEGAAAAPPRLPPLRQRPVVVIDKVVKAGLLLPSVQETIKAVVLALNARYGNGVVVMEDEAINIKQLRRLSRGFKMPESAEEAQLNRLALVEWAVKEAPWRVKATFIFDSKRKAYVSAVECRRLGEKDVVHRAEGSGKTYDAALTDLQPHLKTFCGVLDGVVADIRKAPAPQ